VIEALPQKYYDAGHIPGAVRLNVDEVDRAGDVAPDRARPVVVYCAGDTCRNSHQVAAALERKGYADVTVYAEGKADWDAAGLPLEGVSAKV
jgi:rhodanese-related sulfurtransferase